MATAKRPGSRVGRLLSVAGLLILLSLLSQSSAALPYTIGIICFWIPAAVIAQILVTFPTGRIGPWTEKLLVGAAYLSAAVIDIGLWFFLDPRSLGCTTCPRNLLLIRNDVQLADRISGFNTWSGNGIAAAILVLLAYRWWHATAAGRRVLGPPLWIGVDPDGRIHASCRPPRVAVALVAILLGRSGTDRRLPRRVPGGPPANADVPICRRGPGDRARSRISAGRWAPRRTREATRRSLPRARVLRGRSGRLGR